MTLSDGTYISWWPVNGEMGLIRPTRVYRSRTFQNDIDAEDSDPTTYKIKTLNETSIKQWWQGFKKSERYRSLDNNCSSVIANAVRVGLSDADRSHFSSVLNRGVWTPAKVETLASDLQNDITNVYRSSSSCPCP
jgi:hypothetical protein